MFTSPFDPMELGCLFENNKAKRYYIPLNLAVKNTWILPSNFSILCQEWAVKFDKNHLAVYLKTESGIHFYLKKKMSPAEKKQFEIDWLNFQNSTEEAFDLRAFKRSFSYA